LSALREHELLALANAVPGLNLTEYEYVSFHAPSVLRDFDEARVIEAVRGLPQSWSVVAHPEILHTESWRILGGRLCIENMDNRKTTGRTTAELVALFERFPDAGFCLDVGHARQIDPTMNVAVGMLRMFGDRLRQLHVSEVGPRGEHLRVSRLAQIAFSRLARLVPSECPVIIESVLEEHEIEAELQTVASVFDSANAERLREFAFA